MDIVVDDRAFVVGLSELFRREMKTYEVATLLPLAETVCGALDLSPAMVPVEGYYSESDALERFFRLIRALQRAELRPVSPGPAKQGIQRLREVFTSPAMGRAEDSDRVLPRTSSPFGQALRMMADWSIDSISRQAQRLVRDDDAGLVAVASASGDPIAICVARESMALLAEVELAELETPRFSWAVSEHVAEIAGRFVSSLADTTGIILPSAQRAFSQVYGQAAMDADLVGRCILVGERSGTPHPFYHWYIDSSVEKPVVRDFWSTGIWTTKNICCLPVGKRPSSGARLGAPEAENESMAGGGSSPHRSAAKSKEALEPKGWLARLFQRFG
ncbi:MAG TPA: hypothetical protein VMX13_04830 [Sedimentisphaerales bacterium]|nr:hypothetical protein [Sedimentisphaerales bacterium]